jgi:ABC-type glycerol-3-phosphate transport system substrate-binding protein
VSILIRNKDLFNPAGLDPDKPPATLAEIHEDAKKIRALGDDIYGFYPPVSPERSCAQLASRPKASPSA